MFYRQIFIELVCILTIALASPCAGQLRDDFESGSPRWNLGENDVDARITQQLLSPSLPHAGQQTEQLDVACGQGTFALLTYPLTPTAIIDDLQASLFVRCGSSEIRIGFRVVFPRALNPQTNQPISQVLFGSAARGGGKWSNVSIASPLPLFQQQQFVLRSQYGASIDLRDAFIDAVVLSVYNGPGTIRLAIDDLRVDGAIPANLAESPDSLLAKTRNRGEIFDEASTRLDGRNRQGWRLSDEDLADSTTMVARQESMADLDFSAKVRLQERLNDLQDTIPIWVQYNGEGLGWLRSFDLTGIVTDDPPSLSFLEAANESQLNLICPPPDYTPPQSEWGDYSAVSGWLLGSALGIESLDTTRELQFRMQRQPVALVRPLVLEAMEDYWTYARLADVIAVPAPLPTTVLNSKDAVSQIQRAFVSSHGRSNAICTLTTELAPEWFRQCAAVARAAGVRESGLQRYDTLQHRMQVYRSLASGVRGWYFRSQSPLDSGDIYDIQRVSALRSSIAELRTLLPWLESAGDPVPIPESAIPGYDGAVLPLAGNDLVVLYATGSSDQAVVPAPSSSSILIPINTPNGVGQAFRVSNGRVEPLRSEASENGKFAVLENPGFVELIVLTGDEQTIRFLDDSIRRNAGVMAEGRYDIASQLVRLSQQLMVAMRLPPESTEWNSIKRAEVDLRAALYQMQRREFSQSMEAAERASLAAQRVIRRSWENAMTQFSSPQDSPFLTTPLSLPLHYELSGVLSQRSWSIANWPAAECEDLQRMTDEGFQVDRRLEDRVNATIDLVPGIGSLGSSALRIRAVGRTSDAISGGYAGSSMRLQFPSIRQVPPNSMVRINFVVRLDNGFQEPMSGLLIYDSIAGPAFGQLIDLQAMRNQSAANDWITGSLYRVVDSSEPIDVFIEMRGEGAASIDQLSAEYAMFDGVARYELTPMELTQQFAPIPTTPNPEDSRSTIRQASPIRELPNRPPSFTSAPSETFLLSPSNGGTPRDPANTTEDPENATRELPRKSEAQTRSEELPSPKDS